MMTIYAVLQKTAYLAPCLQPLAGLSFFDGTSTCLQEHKGQSGKREE